MNESDAIQFYKFRKTYGSVTCKQNNQFSEELIHKISVMLGQAKRRELISVNSMFRTGFVRSLMNKIDDRVLKLPKNDLNYLLTKYGANFWELDIRNAGSVNHHLIYRKCSKLAKIDLWGVDVNLEFDIIHNFMNDTIMSLSLHGVATLPNKLLSQIPNFPNLLYLKLSSVEIKQAHLQELLFFLPPNISTVELHKIDVIDDQLINFFQSNLPTLEFLGLRGDMVDSALDAFTGHFPNMFGLALTTLNMSKPNFKFQINPNKIPKLRVMNLVANGTNLENTKLPNLFISLKQPVGQLVLKGMNMSVKYTFDNLRFPNLTKLSLCNCINLSTELLTDIFTKLPTLLYLDLKSTRITDQNFYQLAVKYKSPRPKDHFRSNLQYLNLREVTQLQANFLTYLLHGLPNLEHLDLTETYDEDNEEEEDDPDVDTPVVTSDYWLLDRLKVLKVSLSAYSCNQILYLLTRTRNLSKLEVFDEDIDLYVDHCKRFHPHIQVFDEVLDPKYP